MPVVDFAALITPVAADAPCGPDLDAEGDPDFMNFMARAEGLLPASYFSGPEGLPFDRSQIDLAGEFATAAPFLSRTSDLRLLVMLAKFSILTRSLDDFVTVVRAIAALLETRWDEVHPRADGSDFTSRVGAIETLDDGAPVVFPLQYLPLIQSRRSGAISYRHVMFANGEAQAREGEEAHDRATIDRAFAEAELDVLIALREQIGVLQLSLVAMGTIFATHIGGGQAPKLDKVSALAAKIFGLLNGVIASRDPASAAAEPVPSTTEESDSRAASAPAALAIRSKAEAVAALTAIELYFCRSEPSNPALLLVRQAQQLVGKSFLEAMQILVPGRVGEAKFRLGKDQLVEIPVESLTAFSTVENAQDAAQDEPDTVGETTEAETTADGGMPPESETPARLRAGTRTEVFALLEQIAVYYRTAEPSSPIASIADRARGFSGRDFLTLLKDLLPNPSPE